jgi:hypothetical protein
MSPENPSPKIPSQNLENVLTETRNHGLQENGRLKNDMN